jgi:hypothetical protein
MVIFIQLKGGTSSMKHINYRFSLDMFDTSSQIAIKAKKGDSACRICITLTESGKIYKIADGCYATFSARKADGTFIFDKCTIEDNTIVYDFMSSVTEDGTCQISACEGAVGCEVTLYKADSEQLTSPRFTLVIGSTIYNGEEIVSSSEANALREFVDEIAADVVEKALGNLEVENEYDPTSTNAQSGIAVAQAVEDGARVFKGSLLSARPNQMGMYDAISTDDIWSAKAGDIYINGYTCYSILDVLEQSNNGKRIIYCGLNYANDIEYNPESYNAQSGKAVAEAISGKMDKFGEVKTNNAPRPNGKEVIADTAILIGAKSSTCFLSQTGGAAGIYSYPYDGSLNILEVGTPSDDDVYAAANKLYVDTAIGSIETALDSIIAIQNQLIGGDNV